VPDVEWQPLIDAALEARGRSYSPYSGYAVGAALLGSDGQVYAGCNVENASYPVSMCAERVALGAAVAAGCRDFDALVIATRGPVPGAPCGLCRQALSEHAPDLPILLVTPEGHRSEWTLAELLPGSFGPKDLVTR
jgi:cytidine deaminase